MKKLADLSVLVTRPAGQGDTLAAAIEKAGGQATLFPLLSIEPVQDLERVATLYQQLLNLDQYQILIFISTNAARSGLYWINRYWPRFPSGLEVVAAGPASARALASLPCSVQTSPAGMQSEDLLNLPVLTDVTGKRIALFRGVGGRELLADTLRARGARVDYLETYQRQSPTAGGEELLEELSRYRINCLTLTSGQMLEELCRLIDIQQTGVSLLPLIVPSERIREAALHAGFVEVITSGGATDETLIAALAKLAGQRGPAGERGERGERGARTGLDG